MSALQATVTKFFSLADGTLRIQVDIHHRDSHEALSLLCEVGAQVVVARLVEEQTEQQRYDSVTTTGSGRQVAEEHQPSCIAEENWMAAEAAKKTEGKPEKDPLVGTIMAHFYRTGFFQSPKVLKTLGLDAEFLQWLRLQVCWHCGKQDSSAGDDGGPQVFYVQAAHVRRIAAGSGTSRKPPYSAIPLCSTCHGIQHAVGESGLAPSEWWELQAAKAREEWGHMKLRDKFGAASITSSVSLEVLYRWLTSNDLLNYLPAKVRRSVEQRQREATPGSTGAVGADPVVEG